MIDENSSSIIPDNRIHFSHCFPVKDLSIYLVLQETPESIEDNCAPFTFDVGLVLSYYNGDEFNDYEVLFDQEVGSDQLVIPAFRVSGEFILRDGCLERDGAYSILLASKVSVQIVLKGHLITFHVQIQSFHGSVTVLSKDVRSFIKGRYPHLKLLSSVGS